MRRSLPMNWDSQRVDCSWSMVCAVASWGLVQRRRSRARADALQRGRAMARTVAAVAVVAAVAAVAVAVAVEAWVSANANSDVGRVGRVGHRNLA